MTEEIETLYTTYIRQFIDVCQKDLDDVKILLQDEEIDTYLPELISCAFVHDRADIYEYVLQDPRVNVHDHIFLHSVYNHCCVKMVNYLLQRFNIDPSDRNNEAIMAASSGGNVNVVCRLLEDSRVNPSALKNNAIMLASCGGYDDIVYILLQDRRVNPADCNNNAIVLASHCGFVDVVDLLLQDSRVNPSDSDNKAIVCASHEGHIDIVIKLLNDPRFTLSGAGIYNAIYVASLKENTKIVEILLLHKNIRHPFDFSVFREQSSNVEATYKSIYNKLRCAVCTIMFGMQNLHIPALQLLKILNELYDFAHLIPMHVKWNMIVKIRHYQNRSI